MTHIGIDIGTSYSSVCILNENGQPERVKIATGTSVYGDSYSLPSAVFLENGGKLLLGQAAFASRMRAPQNFKAEFKRDLGQTTPYLLGGLQYMPEDMYKEFFIYIKKCVEDYTHDTVTGATVTFPAMFNDNKKKLIEKAAKAAGLLDVTLIDEPSAAAYCYLNAGKLSEGDTLLVYDLGGGTFDLALMRVKNGQFVQLTQPMGNPRLGGVDFDRMIFNDMMTRIGEDMMASIKTNPIFFSRFAATTMELAVKAKHHLSSSGVFSDYITVGFDGVEYTLEGSRYNAMIAPVLDDTIKQVRAILQTAGLKPSDVNKVLLVGGVSRTPLVRELLSRELGQEPFKDVDPELAVCEGAVAMKAYMRRMEEEKQKLVEELIKFEAERQRELEQQRKAQEEKQRELEQQRKAQEEKQRKQEEQRRQDQVKQTELMNPSNEIKKTANSFSLTIKRESQWFAVNPDIKICIDGDKNYLLANGDEITIELTQGHHNVCLKCAFRKTEFDISIEKDTFIQSKFNRVTGRIDVDFFGIKHSIKIQR